MKSGDGGETWADPLRPYARWPAPWYWASLLLVLALVGAPWAIPDRRGLPLSVERILDTAISDNPVDGESAADLLGFTPLVTALSSFLRNAGTKPPLVLAITAPWGQGKSSIKGMLRRDLERHDRPTIWFNAWHHQKEEHLLASLLSAVRASAVPPWWHQRGMQVRWAMYRTAIRKHPIIAIVAATAVLVPLGLMIAHALGRAPTIAGWTDWIANTLRPADKGGATGAGASGVVHAAASWLAAQAEWLKWAPGAAGVGMSLWLGRNRLKDAGLDPAKLMTTLATNAKVKDLDAQLSFRHRFAREFREAADALAPRSLTIFIDDLDRCRPEAVGEVLEAVNFLVSSGPCVIVLGYYREHVERAVGLHFKDIAGELRPGGEVGDNPKAADEERKREERRRYAQRYLQKLVQLEIPVPRLDDGAAANMLPKAVPADAPQPTTAGASKPVWEQMGRWIAAYWRGWGFASVCAALIVALLTAGLLGGYWLPDAPKPSLQTASPPASSVPPVVAPSTPPTSTSLTTPDPRRIEGTAPYFREGQTSRWPWEFFVGVLLLVGFACFFVAAQLQQREDRRQTERDSDAFIDAIAVWSTLLQRCLTTPRELKRFVNEVRFYAARSQAATAELNVSESAVVALASLRTLDQRVRSAVGDRLPSTPLHTLDAVARKERFSAMYKAVREVTPNDEALARLVVETETILSSGPHIADEDRSAFTLWSEGVRI